MKVFLTGATGLIGAHTALALLEAGHELKLLVRNEKLARDYFEARGHHIDDFVVGDMQDKALLEQGMAGCDAVLHSAAMVSLDPKKSEEIYRSNINSIDAVIGTAHKLGISNIVYVSSLGAFFIPDGGPITEDSPLGSSKEAYTQSKIDCEKHVRKLQQQGLPIQITYPGGTFGPDDPKLNESNHSLCSALLKLLPLTSSGLQCVDARDLALIHVYLLEHQPENFEQARYLVAGRYYPWRELKKIFDKVTGRNVPAVVIPGALMRFFGLLGDGVKKIYPMDYPMTSEAMAICTQWPVADSSKVIKTTGVTFRSGEETFSDTIRWLSRAGYLDRKLAGRLGR